MRTLSLAVLALALDPRLGQAAQEAVQEVVQGGARDGKSPEKLPYEGTLSVSGTIPEVDVSCILSSWTILGVLACPTILGGVHVCLLVENAYPTGILEVVRQEYRSHYAEMGGMLGAMRPLPLFGKSASATARAGAGDSLQFGEARAYTFVPDPGLSGSDLPLAVPSGSLFQVDYVSELDGYGWRLPALETFAAPQSGVARLKSCDRAPDPATCAGCWGSFFPRVGMVEHPSQVIAAHVQALRAGRAASSPLGRVVLATYPYEPRTGHYLQMLRPSYRTALPIGSPRISIWEKGAGSSYGAYAFLHYGVFIACSGCLPVTLAPERAPF